MAGLIIAIGISSLERNSLAPTVPTVAESGFPGFEATTNWSLLGQAGLPAPIVGGLSTAMRAAMAAPEVIERLRAVAIVPLPDTPEDFHAYLATESRKWGEVIRTPGIVLK